MDGESTMALRRLGEVLIAEGSITEEQLAAAIAEQERTGERLGEILLARRSVSRLNLANAFAEQHADARRSVTAQPTSADADRDAEPLASAYAGSAGASDGDLARKVAERDVLLAWLVSTAERLDARVSELEALIPAITEALESGAPADEG
jgi:hypothetical protein